MITADERWKLFVLFQSATQKAETKGKAWAHVDRPGTMQRCADAQEDLIQANREFREYLDTLVDPASKQAGHDKVAGDIAAIIARR